MRKILAAVTAILVLTPCANNVLAQRGSDNCEMYVVDGDAKKDVMLEKFTTTIGEEELTNQTYPFLKTGLFITASVYYTDESMASEHGYDSMMLGVAVSKKPLGDAFSTPNNAFAEVTLATLDMIRAKMYYKVKGRTYLIGIQCSKGKHEDINQAAPDRGLHPTASQRVSYRELVCPNCLRMCWEWKQVPKGSQRRTFAREVRRFVAARISSAETRSFIEEPLTSTYRYRAGHHPSYQEP